MIFEKQVINIYKNTLLTRHDADGSVFYFSKSDFPGLLCEESSFTGNKGQRLSAYLYYRDAKRTDRLVIFEHGMGCGHAAYMKEVNLLTEHGYTVFTYDHTGTRCSEGENIGGFSQSLADLDYAIRAIRRMPEYKDTPLSVIGHSWGGFSTMNIPAIYPEITHVVALSGFISTKAIQDQSLGGILKFYRKCVYSLEREALPGYFGYSATDSLKNKATKALIIHSKDDPVVKSEYHFELLRRELAGLPNIEFLELNGKSHNPNYTADAIAYKNSFFQALKKAKKKKMLSTEKEKKDFVSSFDWHRMTAQDMSVWDKIFAFLEK